MLLVMRTVLTWCGIYLCFLQAEAIIPRERFFVAETTTSDVDINSGDIRGNNSRIGSLDSFLEGRNPLTALLPIEWQEFCKAEFKFVSGSNFTGQRAVYVHCTMQQHHYWSLQDYRDWISANEKDIYKYLPIKTGLLFAFKFQCSFREGRVSLPWPLRAKYLWYVAVDDCTLLDHLLEFEVTQDSKDYLKVVEMTNCNMETDTRMLFHTMMNFRNVSRDFDCGGEIAEKMVLSSLRKTFSSPEEDELIDIKQLPTGSKMSALDQMIAATLNDNSNSSQSEHMNTKPSQLGPEDMEGSLGGKTHRSKLPALVRARAPHVRSEQQMIDGIAKIGQDNQKIDHRCVYKHLEYLDQSRLHSRSRHHSHILLERSHYPALEFFNLSHSYISHMSVQTLEWRRYFPNMRYMDLSHNRIKYFNTLSDNGRVGDPVGVLDLRHNNITTLTPEDLRALSIHSRTVYVDIRDNPLNCDCKLAHFVTELRNTSNKLFTKYKYLRNMTCASPDNYKGAVIASLGQDFCTALEVTVLLVPIIVLCSCIVLLVVAFIVIVRYRREIMILAFTRLHVSLPCRHTLNVDKDYDAFIAYSEKDGDWVFHTLLPRLELPAKNQGPGFKLCIHHRDFLPGRCISDNIVDGVHDSRHTVLILSNHFLRSQWCRYEFKTAFTQSILEKKRHLIMVLKEELDKQLIDTDLKRCLKTFTYVETNDRLFWDKLIFALADGAKKKADHNFNIENGPNRNQGHHIKAERGNEMQQLDVNIHVNNVGNVNRGNVNRGNVNGRNVNDIEDPLVWHINENDIDNHNQGDINDQPILGRHEDRPGPRPGRGQDNRGFMQEGVWDV